MLSRTSRSYLLSVLFLVTPVVGLGGCAVDSTEASSEAMTEQGPTAVIIDEAGDGQTFDVVEGQQIIVRLPGNPTTGYEWVVASTDRTFGYPVDESYTPEGGEEQVGSGGTFEFVWESAGALSMVGTHTVTLEYKRAWEDEAADTFTFTVKIAPEGEPPTDDVLIDETGDGKTFDVVEGGDVLVRLAGNPSTGYAWTVASTDRTFGYPVSEDYIPDGGGTGSGGVYEFVWKTDGALPMVGAHTVVMAYGRSWETEPLQTITFTVNILPTP